MSHPKRSLLWKKTLLLILDLPPSRLSLSQTKCAARLTCHGAVCQTALRRNISPPPIKLEWTIFSGYLLSQNHPFFIWMWYVPCPSCQRLSGGRMYSYLKWMIKYAATAQNRCYLENKMVSIVKELWPLSNTPLKLVTNCSDARSIR